MRGLGVALVVGLMNYGVGVYVGYALLKHPETIASHADRRLNYPITDLTEEHLEKITKIKRAP